jgi:ribulose-phosphate 3-epimerase
VIGKEVFMNDNIWNEKCVISPSLICLDMLHLEEQIHELEEAGIQMLHVDILDGHFSPSMPLGFETVKQLRKITDLPFECHVMADPPEYFVDELLDIGVQQITFQMETAPHIDGLINHIHNAGVRAGLALKPATPIGMLEYEIEKCDSVLIMQINPGYASSKGESRTCFSDRKIRDVRKMINDKGLGTKVIIDGRVSMENIRDYGSGIVDIFVGGTTCISKSDIKGSVAKTMRLREKIINGQGGV